MGQTKIINVLKTDDFEDIFELFKETAAREVIFVLPKGSRLAAAEVNFETLGREAQNSGKMISLLTSDPKAQELAKQFGFELLNSTASSEELFNEVEPVAELTAYKTRLPEPSERMIRDVFPTAGKKRVNIKREKTPRVDLDINRALPDDREVEIGQIWHEQEIEERRPTRVKSNRHWFSGKLPFIFGGVAVLVLLAIIYIAFGKAELMVQARKEELNFSLKVSASTLASSVSLEFNKLPGQSFNQSAEESGIFPASGQKNVVQKAVGRITIYNTTTSSQRLVATTRFESPVGLIFRIPASITVPAGTRSGSNIIPGTIESDVAADRPGQEYNIGPARFTIPGFKGSNRFESFYGTSSSATKGGLIGPSKVVSGQDFAKAREALTVRLEEKIINLLKSQIGDLETVSSPAIKFDQPTSNVKADEAAENLEMTLKASIGTIAFRSADARQLVNNYLLERGNLQIVEEKTVISFDQPSLSEDGKVLDFRINVSGLGAVRVDKEKILSDILGMNREEIKAYFSGLPEVESARVVLSPWLYKIPKDSSRVRVDIN